MVLEMLLSARENVLHDWWKLLSLGVIYAILGLGLAVWVFPQYASMVMIFLTVLAMAHVMHEMIDSVEEYDEEAGHQPFDIFVHHWRAIFMFVLLFAGMLLAYTFWYSVLDWHSVSTIFAAQNTTVARIVGHVTGGATGNVTVAQQMNRFGTIFTNNMWVLFFSLIFGLFYGYGALFVLSWNASVIAAAAGSTIKQAIAAGSSAPQTVLTFFGSILGYMPHGIFEIGAYFVAALASGILGAAIARRVWTDPDKTNRVFIDFLEYTLLSVILLFVAAIIEVWITPVLHL